MMSEVEVKDRHTVQGARCTGPTTGAGCQQKTGCQDVSIKDRGAKGDVHENMNSNLNREGAKDAKGR